jgi:hypothetical protein
MRSDWECKDRLMARPAGQCWSLLFALALQVKRRVWLPLVAVSAVSYIAVGCGTHEQPIGGPGDLYVLSAADYYSEASDRASKWSADAYLDGMSADVAYANGSDAGPSLSYTFHSPSAAESFYVLWLVGGTWSSEVVESQADSTMPRPIGPEQWSLDSTDAWEIAVANGVEAFLLHYRDPATMAGVTLDYWTTDSGQEVLAWAVRCSILYGPSLHMLIDPKSGDIIDIEERSVSGTLVATTPTLPATPWAPLPVCTPATPEPAGATGLPERIAFESSRDGPLHIYLMDPDGSNIVQLTDGPGADTNAAWSPDGQRIAFTNTSGLDIDIYVVDADGANLQRLTDDPAYDREPSWSPDGRYIAFSSDRDGNDNLYLMDSDGSNLSLLTDHPSEDQSPAWSPDGCRIAFVSSRDHWPEAHICVMNIDGSNVTQLTSGSTLDYGPRWSPDGTRIAFWSRPISVTESQANVYVMDQDGGHQVRLTTGFCGGFRPVWSPDGERIAFATGRDDPFGSDIFVMDADGSNVEQLTHEPEDNWPSSWR